MVDIMKKIHTSYVPTKQCDQTYAKEGSNNDIIIPDAKIHPILFGGDQLTATRARGAKKAKVNSVDPSLRFDGLIPVAADWHTRLNFIGVRDHAYIT